MHLGRHNYVLEITRIWLAYSFFVCIAELPRNIQIVIWRIKVLQDQQFTKGIKKMEQKKKKEEEDKMAVIQLT